MTATWTRDFDIYILHCTSDIHIKHSIISLGPDTKWNMSTTELEPTSQSVPN